MKLFRLFSGAEVDSQGSASTGNAVPSSNGSVQSPGPSSVSKEIQNPAVQSSVNSYFGAAGSPSAPSSASSPLPPLPVHHGFKGAVRVEVCAHGDTRSAVLRPVSDEVGWTDEQLLPMIAQWYSQTAPLSRPSSSNNLVGMGSQIGQATSANEELMLYKVVVAKEGDDETVNIFSKTENPSTSSNAIPDNGSDIQMAGRSGPAVSHLGPSGLNAGPNGSGHNATNTTAGVPSRPSSAGFFSVPMMSSLVICAIAPFDLKLRSLPLNVVRIRSLSYLHLEQHDLGILPSGLGELKALQVLRLPRNGIRVVPSELRGLSNLEILDLSQNVLSSLPEEMLSSMRGLRELHLERNQISMLPVDFSKATQLESVNLQYNRLTVVPISLLSGAFSKLQYLDLGHNLLTNFSIVSGPVSSLDGQNHTGTSVTSSSGTASGGTISSPGSGPATNTENALSFSDPPKLLELRLSHNRFLTLPPLSALVNLELLDLSHNRLRDFPSPGESLTRLQTLRISKNQLREVPASLKNMNSLKILDLSENSIDSWTLPLGHMTQLQFLNASRNLLSTFDLPKAPGEPKEILLHDASAAAQAAESIGTAVEEVDIPVGNIELVDDSKEASGRTDIVLDAEMDGAAGAVSASDNPAQGVGSPAAASRSVSSAVGLTPPLSPRSVCMLPKSLRELNLSWNRLNSLPVIVAGLENLEGLICHHNHLGDFPEELHSSRLPKMLHCDFSYNRIGVFPSSFLAGAPNLTSVNISENPLLSLPKLDLLDRLVKLDVSSSAAVVVPDFLPLSLRELSLANVRINETLQDVSIIRHPNGISPEDPEFVLSFLLATSKALGHPVVVFSIARLSEDEIYQALFAKADCARKLDQIFGILQSTPHARSRLYCLRALNNFFRHPKVRRAAVESNRVPYLLSIACADCENDAETRAAAVRSVYLGALDGGLRAMIWLQLQNVQNHHAILHDSSKLVRREAIRLLRAVGDHETLHFGPKSNRRSNGVRILALDGGGTRGLVSIKVLEYLERATGGRVHEHFDLICGTSAGAMIAAQLGQRHLSSEEIRLGYKRTLNQIFANAATEGAEKPSYIGKLFNLMYLVRNGAFYKSSPLVELIREHCGSTDPSIEVVLERNEHALLSKKLSSPEWRDLTRVFRKEEDCGSDRWDVEVDPAPALTIRDVKVFFASLRVDISPPAPFLWRNYHYLPSVEARFQGTALSSSANGLRASTAAPSFFDEYVPQDLAALRGQRHVDGAMGYNNPAMMAVQEAKRLWPNRTIDCVVSIGTGDPHPKSSSAGWQGVLGAMVAVTTSPFTVDHMLEDLMPSNNYFRFNPVDDAFDCPIDEVRESKMEEMVNATVRYLDSKAKELEVLANLLIN